MKTPAPAFRERTLALLIPLVLFAATSVHAQRTWNGAGIGNDWSTTANWVNGEPVDWSSAADDAIIDSTAVNFMVDITQPGEIARVVEIGRQGSATGTMTGGDLQVRSLRLVADGAGATSTFNFTNGTITVNDNVGGNLNQGVHISGDGLNIAPAGTAVFNMGDVPQSAC